MRSILAACRRARNLEYVGIVAAFAVVLNVVFQLLPHFLLLEPRWAIPVGYPGLVALLAVLGGVILLWIGAHLLGYVSVTTGAGFRIACLGLLGRLIAWTFPALWGTESHGLSVYDALPSIGDLVWLLRNIGLAAYAYGIAFVALSCWSEIDLRRRTPAWIRSAVDPT